MFVFIELAYLNFKILTNISFSHYLLILNFEKSLLIFNKAYYRGIYNIKLIYNIADDTDLKNFFKSYNNSERKHFQTHV